MDALEQARARYRRRSVHWGFYWAMWCAVLWGAWYYWSAEVRATLTDVFSGALVEEIEDRLDNGEYFGAGKVLVKFKMTPFGRRRMVETGLLPEQP